LSKYKKCATPKGISEIKHEKNCSKEDKHAKPVIIIEDILAEVIPKSVTGEKNLISKNEITANKSESIPIPVTVIGEQNPALKNENTANKSETIHNQILPNKSPYSSSALRALKELDEATLRLKELDVLIDKTFAPESRNCRNTLILVGTHIHDYTGNRQWRNQSCAICRHTNSTFVDDRTVIAAAEKEKDQINLNLSFQADKEYFEQKKV
jgi:hypothetical protein